MTLLRSLTRPIAIARPAAPMALSGKVLSIDHVAVQLRCSIDAVRRIPRSELPARQGPGKQLLYLGDDVLSYVSKKPVQKHSGWRGTRRDQLKNESKVVRLDSSPFERVRRNLA